MQEILLRVVLCNYLKPTCFSDLRCKTDFAKILAYFWSANDTN